MIKYPLNINKENFQEKSNNLDALYGLNKKVEFCSYCTFSNQKPDSAIEFKHNEDTKKNTLIIEGKKCASCRVQEQKNSLNWEEREHKLKKLCDKFRSRNGSYDCIVPGSGGKDSFAASYILKNKFKMNPITVTWAPNIYTPWGLKNFLSWIKSGYANNLFHANGLAMRILTRLALEKLLHPFQPFMMGQKQFIPRLAAKHYKIPLVFYGDTDAEVGTNESFDQPLRNKAIFSNYDNSNIFISGTQYDELIKDYDLSHQDLIPFIPLKTDEVVASELQIHYLGYYIKWHPQECFYLASEKGGFECSPERTCGTYTKSNSLDDKIDDLHFYTTYIKFGIGRATYDSAQEIRNGEITREEGISLVQKYDGEYPSRFLKEILEYLSLNKEFFPKSSLKFEENIIDQNYFNDLVDNFRSPHLWKFSNDKWQLRHTIF